MSGIVHDKRTDDERAATIGYVVGTDRFMSGWGEAPGTSYYAVAVSSTDEREIVEANMRGRSEMLRVRFNLRPPRARSGDHVSIVGPEEAGPWFERGRWS